MDQNWQDLCRTLLITKDQDEFSRLIDELNVLFEREEITRRSLRKPKSASADNSGLSEHSQQR
ncbi:MAG: hypothetical protein ACRD2S_08165 [Terriglobales bacterium]